MKITILAALIFFLLITIPIATFLVSLKWVLPEAAQLPSPLIFSPTQGTFPVNHSFAITVFVNTEGQPIDGVDLAIEAHNLNIGFERLTLPNGLSYQKEPEILQNTVKFSLLTLPGQPFTNNEPQALINLLVSARVHCANARLAINPELSVVASAGHNILGSPVEPQFTITTPGGITNPEFTSPTETIALLNQNFTYTATATNPNQGVLEFSFFHLPNFLTASGSRLSGTPDQVGDYTIDMEVVDGKGGSACARLKLIVTNDAPIEISNIRSSPSHNQAVITWTTNRFSTSQVDYGPTNQYGQSTTKNQNLVKDHAATLNDLSPATTYHFRVRSEATGVPEAISADHTFTTTTQPQKTLNIQFQFQGKRANQNNHLLTLWAKGTDYLKAFEGAPDGTFSLSLSQLPNRDTPYEFVLKGYQNLSVKRNLTIKDGANPPSGYLSFGILPAGDIAPAGATDNLVNSLDWGFMVDEWNMETNKKSVADINDDKRVNSLDYSLLISRFGLKGEE